MNKDFVNYAYMIFATPYGKGYGCFAVQTISPGNFKVAASFCSFWDARRFSKKKARLIALNRLKTDGCFVEVSLDKDLKDDFRTLSNLIFKSDLNIPNWARDAYDIDAYYFTLKENSKAFFVMVSDLNLDGIFFERLYKAMYDNGLI